MDSTDATNDGSARLLEELYTNENLGFDRTSELLSEFRILTREKNLKSDIINGRCIEALVRLATNHHTEAQKCLSNLILNYAHFRELVIEPYVECVQKRFETVLHNDRKTSSESSEIKQLHEVLYYDLRIIFLLSALCSSSRSSIRDRLLDLILRVTEKEADNFSQDSNLLVVESLKTMFNLTLDKFMSQPLAGNVIKKLFHVLHDSDKTISITTDQIDQLLVNLINLLTNMSEEVYMQLSDADVDKILQHLDSQLISYSKANARETVLPVLNVCANICKYKDETRRRWFEEIVGSVKDFEKRPEEYETLRGRLVKLMTSVDVHLKDIAADFMHALCGGDTEKFITYTGFGNSAAFLSSRGLLGGLNRKKSSSHEQDELSAYEKIRDKVDPITGRIEVAKRNPMEGMTEEEREYHAHELATAITKLTNIGLVKPMSINPETGDVRDIHPSTSETHRK